MVPRPPDPRRRLLVALALARGRSAHGTDALLRRALEVDDRDADRPAATPPAPAEGDDAGPPAG